VSELAADYGVLEILARAGQAYTDAESLCEATRLETAGVVRVLDLLQRLGLPVESHPVYGYRLPIPFDLIDCQVVGERLRNAGAPCTVQGALDVSSTNDLVNAEAGSGGLDGFTCFAEYQSKGRGRLGRKWYSPVGSGLWFSVLRIHDLAMDGGWRVTLGTGIAVAQAVAKLTGLTPALKWPNDVHIDGRKVAGILTETRSSLNRLQSSTIGIGLNVHTDTSEFPEDLRETAVSIRSAGGHVARGDLLVEILLQLQDVSTWSGEQILNVWREKCQQWGRRVRVEGDRGIHEGIALDVAEDGAFVVELDSGESMKVHSGDVTHLRTVT
jgi:BirA family biotin operon repressor/biotin-[acetyl-CoA-carboxylase] ligase